MDNNLPPGITPNMIDHEMGDHQKETVEEDQHDEEIFTNDNDNENEL